MCQTFSIEAVGQTKPSELNLMEIMGISHTENICLKFPYLVSYT